MSPELRPYQQEDVAFLEKLDSAGCFNEQRTGKTPTALILASPYKKILIICPGSAMPQWKDEFEKWLGRPCITLIGTPQKRNDLFAQWTDGLIVSYDIFKSTLKGAGLVKDIVKHPPDFMIVDEAHRIKNPKSAAAKSVFACKKFTKKLALTATPAHGKSQEIYSILHWLYPTRFTGYWAFVDEFFAQEKKWGANGTQFIDIGGYLPGKELELQQYLATISTQRKRKEVMPWLPLKDYTQIRLEPTKHQTKYLAELQQFYETEHVITQGTLDRLIRYRQICLAPALLDLKGESPKSEWIKQYLKDYPEESVIIFSKFTSYLKLLQQELLEFEPALMIGATPIPFRKILVNEFQKKRTRILLLNLDVGKEALTLDTATTTIFCDKYPPIGDIAQAEDRFVSTTEDKKDKPHKIIELMIKDTYDEELYKLLESRASETDVLNNYKLYLERRKL